MAQKRLLIVANTPSENTRVLRDAVVRGAQSPDIEDVEVRALDPLEAGPDDILAARGIILGTTENLGYMSGALKARSGRAPGMGGGRGGGTKNLIPDNGRRITPWGGRASATPT